MKPKPLVISLFTGAGGLDLGLEAAGFEIVGSIEKDPSCRRTLELNRPKWKHLDTGDIFDINPRDALNFLCLKRKELSLISGGPPCQPFSQAGLWSSSGVQRLADPRARTIDAYFSFLEYALPKAFVFENVKGLLSTADALTKIRAKLKKINRTNGTKYELQVISINAADYGVPQQRERVFLLAHRGGKLLNFPDPTHGPNSKSGVPWLNCWDAIGHLDRKSQSSMLTVTGKWSEVLPSIPEGLNYLWHTPRGGGEPLFGWRTKYWSFLLKLSKDQPAWTLSASPGPATGPFHWKNRKLSIEEMCRLQTFPENYKIFGNYSVARKQLGNAVPSALAELIGLEIRRQFFGEKVRLKPNLIPKRVSKYPRAEQVTDLPRKFKKMRSDHPDHPGSGQGPKPRTWARAVQF